jgi:hypothetical protein
VTVLAVDLAAKYSAACLMDDDYKVISQFDSWLDSEDAFVYRLASPWMVIGKKDPGRVPDVMIIEDLPHGLSYSRLVKKVLRLQGRIVQAMYDTTDGGPEDIVFVAPNTWRAHYQGMQRGTGSGVVVPVSARFGYTPPDFTERARGRGGKSRADKIATDYCSAYLIARWAIDTKQKYGGFDVPGTSRYDTNVILKKDFDAKSDHAAQDS